MTKKPDYKKGILDKDTSVAKGLIGQRIVAKTLGLSLKNDCNCSIGFNAKYDLYDKDMYKKIDVKTSKKRRYDWSFKFYAKKQADNYICLGFDENRKNILHVWVVPNIGRVKNLVTFIVYNSQHSLFHASKWEVDAKPYNDMLHKMSKKRKKTNGKNCVLNNDDLNL